MQNTCYSKMLEYVDKSSKVVHYDHSIPMRKILADVEAFAGFLADNGIARGDVVTLYLPTCPQSVVAFYACSKLGVVANIVHPLTPVEMLKQNLEQVGSKMLLFYDVLVQNENVLPQNQILVRCSIADYVTLRKPLYRAYSWATSKRTKALCYHKATESTTKTQHTGCQTDVVCTMHSGGTSGKAKIVQLSNQAFNSVALSCIQWEKVQAKHGDLCLVTLPVFHAFGLCIGIHAPLLCGYGLALLPKFKAKSVVHYIKKYSIAMWGIVPIMAKKVLKHKGFDGKHLAKLKYVWCGGDFLEESLVENFDHVLQKNHSSARVLRGYGLTECCSVCAVNSPEHYQKNSCGKAIPNCTLQIWDEDGNVLPPNTIGEVAILSAGVMTGYIGTTSSLVDKNGTTWLLSGDYGYINEQGFLFVVDRKKRSFKIAAVNVFPSEIENCVESLPCIDQACAVPYRSNDKPFIKLYVTLNKGVDEQIACQQCIDICKQKLLPYSVPSKVEVIATMPTTPLGKKDFRLLEKANLK